MRHFSSTRGPARPIGTDETRPFMGNQQPPGAGTTLAEAPAERSPRRGATRALAAAATVATIAGGIVAVRKALKRRAADSEPVHGVFPNGMAYLRMGRGPRTLLWIPGGPGNALATGGLSVRMKRIFSRPFLEQGYTVWWVARRQDMPKGYSFADMADDYGQLIADEFDGRVDVAVGMSTGGQIGFYLAARHPDRAGHFVIVAAGYKDGERAKAMLPPSARLLSEGKIGQAMALMISDMHPSWPRPAVRVLAEPLARSMYGGAHEHFANDVLVEAAAELACDAREVLPLIPVPVLLVCGDRDPWCPRDIYEETARLIPMGTLAMYPGRAHEDVLTDSRFGRDVADFIGRSPGTSDTSAGRTSASR